jgi:formylglycine-generating enzyme required for sulfatase activity
MCKYCNNTLKNKPVNGECLLETKLTVRLTDIYISLLIAGIPCFSLFALLRFFNFLIRDKDVIIPITIWCVLAIIINAVIHARYQPIFLIDDNLQTDGESINSANKFLLLNNKVKFGNNVYAIPKRFRQSPHDLVEFLNCQEWRRNNSIKLKSTEKNIETINDFLKDFKLIQGGNFLMGSPETEEGRKEDEVQHEVTLNSFYMQSVVVTQGLFNAVTGKKHWKSDEHPHWKLLPYDVFTWEKAQEFIAELNLITGRNYRMPTEAEWEFAARGGINSNGFIFSGSNDLSEVGFYYENVCDREKDPSGCSSQLVGSKRPNELGLFDMSGNCSEWCSDWYGPYLMNHGSNFNPKGADIGSFHVARGGDHYSSRNQCRSAYRNSEADTKYACIRLVHD